MNTVQKYDSPFDVEGRMAPIIVVADLGNNYLKVALLRYEVSKHENGGIFKHEVVMKHAFVELSPKDWRAEVENSDGNLSRGTKSKTHAFELKVGKEWKAIKIGNGVENHRYNKPLLGSQKYVKGGIDALLVAALCELLPEKEYPDGHDNIILGIGHPPTEFHQVRDMVKLVQPKGGHNIRTPNNVKRNFTVRVTIPYDESVGGLMHMQHTLNTNGQMRDAVSGQFIKNPLREGDRLIMIDAGGRLGSIGWITYEGGNRFDVDYNSFLPIEGGMITIREIIRESISSEYSKEFRGVTRVEMDDKWVDAIIKTRKVVVKGNYKEPLDLSETVEKSLTYLNTLREVYQNNFGSGVTAAHITLTGGTIRDLHDEIVAELEHGSIIPVASLDEINKANMSGGVFIVLDTLEQNQKMPRQFQGEL